MSPRRIPGWIIPMVLLGAVAYALAEDLTLTTYYPSPRGVYQELRTRGNVTVGQLTPGPGDPPPRLTIVGGGGIQHPLRVEDTPIPGGDPTPFEINSDGQVGIGTATPASGIKLHVVGTVRMDGFQMGTVATPGHVLTTDLAGVGTWQPAGGSSAPGTPVAWAIHTIPNGWQCFAGPGCTGSSGSCYAFTELWDPQNVMTINAIDSQSAMYSSCNGSGYGKIYQGGSCADGYQYIYQAPYGWSPTGGIGHPGFSACVKQ